MTAYIVRGVPKSILKDGWWLVDTSDDLNDTATPKKPKPSGRAKK